MQNVFKDIKIKKNEYYYKQVYIFIFLKQDSSVSYYMLKTLSERF